jgi:glycosyltransferase involved in cell wall biosynthesis
VPIAARIAAVAEFVEVANRVGGVDAARRLARERYSWDDLARRLAAIYEGLM